MGNGNLVRSGLVPFSSKRVNQRDAEKSPVVIVRKWRPQGTKFGRLIHEFVCCSLDTAAGSRPRSTRHLCFHCAPCLDLSFSHCPSTQYATFFFPSCEGAGCGPEAQKELYTLPVLPSLDGGGGSGEVVVRTWTITSVYGKNGPLEIAVQAKVCTRAPQACGTVCTYYSHGLGALLEISVAGCSLVAGTNASLSLFAGNRGMAPGRDESIFFGSLFSGAKSWKFPTRLFQRCRHSPLVGLVSTRLCFCRMYLPATGRGCFGAPTLTPRAGCGRESGRRGRLHAHRSPARPARLQQQGPPPERGDRGYADDRRSSLVAGAQGREAFFRRQEQASLDYHNLLVVTGNRDLGMYKTRKSVNYVLRG